jgi:hypothetical protein
MKYAMAEHRFEMGHNIDFSSTSILDKATVYMDCVIKEAVEVRFNLRNLIGMVASLSVGPGTH